jgi:hypothetical protein
MSLSLCADYDARNDCVHRYFVDIETGPSADALDLNQLIAPIESAISSTDLLKSS